MRMVAFGVDKLWNPRQGSTLPERFTSVKEFLDLRMSALRDTPVDTISYCGVFTWPVWDLPRERIAVLGADPLQPVIDFAHQNGKDFFFNIRMNDCHTSGPFWQGPVWWEPFRLNNRDCLQSRISDEEWEQVYLPWIHEKSNVYPLKNILERRGSDNRDIQSWATYDYAQSKVRDYFLGLIQEACERYDLDGIDLDWLRAPYFFQFGEERRHVPVMNDFVRRAAQIVRNAGKKRGRPILLCMRVPDSPSRALELGLDVTHWISEKWLDLLVAGNGLAVFSAPLLPWQRLCRPQGIPVYACITRSAPSLGEPSAVLGACQRMWRHRADGLYFFNHFIPEEYATITQGSDTKIIRGMTKSYALDTQHTAFENATVIEGPVPMVFSGCTGDATAKLTIEIPESLNKVKAMRLQIKWRGTYRGEDSHWFLNGKQLKDPECRNNVIVEYDAHGLKTGLNQLCLEISSKRLMEQSETVLESVAIRIERK